MDNNETIAKLYSIRAGLSLIAKEKDTMEKELANAEQQKAMEITQARIEAEAKIMQDQAGVRRAEEEAKSKQQQIRNETSKQVQKINDEISERQSRINQSKNQAADDAEQSLASRMPSEPRDKYDEARKKYNKNKRTLKEEVSSYCSDSRAFDTTKCVLGILFCLLHVAIAAYEAWSIATVNVTGWVYWVAVLVTIAIMSLVIYCGHHDEFFDYDSKIPEWLCPVIVAAAYLIYLANIGSLLASAVILGLFSNLSDFSPISESSQLLPLMISVCVTTGLALIITLWRTIVALKENSDWEYIALSISKRKAKAENRKLEKELEKAKLLDEQWEEYDRLVKQARNEAATKNVSSGSAYGLQTANSRSREEADDLKYQSDRKIREIDENVQKRQAEHEEFRRQTDSQCEEQCKAIEQHYADACEALTTMHTKAGNDIWNNLVENYGKLLDSRDWQILDLVIWQLETGRADTIKEALQLADRETQTERLEMAISSASQSIATKIQTEFFTLKTDLHQQFGDLADCVARSASYISWELSKKLDGQSRQIAQGLSLNAASIAALAEVQSESMLASASIMDELVSQSSLQTALMEKSNSSSKELIAAVNKLRESRRY